MARPVVGITTDIVEADGRQKADVSCEYARCVERAGGTPILLPAIESVVRAHVELCDAFVLTGGDDPDTRAFGIDTHPQAKIMSPKRQTYEMALLEALRAMPRTPVLGICLGMQLMGLSAGAELDQHLPDSTPTHEDHRRRNHRIAVDGSFAFLQARAGEVWSNHHQALRTSGALRVFARAEDGVIEGVVDDSRPFFVGVQWHPERTREESVGQALFEALVAAVPNRKL
jgi:putative glutamine amidotransferase